MQSSAVVKGGGTMPDLLIRNVPEPLMRRLKAQAERNDRSVQKEALDIIDKGTQLTMAEWLTMAEAFREESRAWGYVGDSTALIREDRDSR